MKKQLLNIKDFVHINLSRGDKSEVLSEDLINAEKRVDLIRQSCQNTEKKISACLLTAGGGMDSTSVEKRLKKMPMMQLQQSFQEFSDLLCNDSVLGLTLSECAKLQNLMGKELLNCEIDIEKQCLSALTNVIENDIPIVSKSRKQLHKATSDMDAYRVKYQAALKQMQQNTGSLVSNPTKAESLKKELEDASVKVDHSRDVYATEMFNFLSREAEYADIFLNLYRIQANYHRKMQEIMEVYLPLIERVILNTSQKPVFGTSLEEHLRVTGREISVVIETCIGLLLNNLNEEGLFRIPGSTSKVRKLKSAFDAGIVDIEEYSLDPHTVAGSLKSYLRELPESLFTSALYNEWMSAAKVNDSDSRLQAMWHVCNKLPKANFENLRYIIKFLTKLSANSDVNKMSSQNLAIAMAPSLIWTPQTDSPFDANMTSANLHSLILDTLLNYNEWFFPGEITLSSITLTNEKLSNGDHFANENASSVKAPLVHRSAKKPAPPVPSQTKKVERKGSLTGTKTGLIPRHSVDQLEYELNSSNATSLESGTNATSRESKSTSFPTAAQSSVMYSTGSLDRHGKTSHEKILPFDKKENSIVNLRNKNIEKPNVPPPCIPPKTERPFSVYERPSLPPPERPHRACDANKVKQCSLENLTDSSGGEADSLNEEKHLPKATSKLYPSLDEFDSNDAVSKDDNFVDSTVESSNDKEELIAFADDSDSDDKDNKSNDLQKDMNQIYDEDNNKQTIVTPKKPPRTNSPANLLANNESVLKNSDDQRTIEDNKLVSAPSDEMTSMPTSPTQTKHQIKPPRPQLPATKPRFAKTSENTHL